MTLLNKLVIALVFGGVLGSAEAFGAASGAPQTVSGGGVTITVTYLNPSSGEEPRFHVGLDTHSVSLDAYDLKNMTVLRDDTGKDYTPTAAENKGGGHHREATLTFPKISAGAKRSEMVITDVAGV